MGPMAAGARLVDAISELTGLEDHHPDIDLRWEGVIMRLITITDDRYGLSERDVELAWQISAVARELGVPADPSVVQTVQVSIDALVIPEVLPFWRAVLGYQDRDPGGEDLIDPNGLMSLWQDAVARSRSAAAEALAGGGLDQLVKGITNDRGESPSLRRVLTT